MTAAEARKGGKATDLDPPMDVLKSNWLREVDEFVDGDDSSMDDVRNDSLTQPPSLPPPQQQQHQQQQPTNTKAESKAPPTPTTPSTRSMAIDSIVDKVDAA
jgi:hypothetical protein